MRKRRISLVAVGLLGALLAGCTPNACPAVAWDNTAAVTLVGPTSDVAEVQLCADGVCSERRGSESRTPEPLQLSTMTAEDLATFTPTPESMPVSLPPLATRSTAGSWSFSFSMSAPQAVTVRALSADGEVLAELDTDLDWDRVGGSAACGGPGRAGPVVLSIPAS